MFKLCFLVILALVSFATAKPKPQFFYSSYSPAAAYVAAPSAAYAAYGSPYAYTAAYTAPYSAAYVSPYAGAYTAPVLV